MFDVTNKKSFDALPDMIEAFNHKNPNPAKLLILIGNKAERGEPR
jgi:GTPase SAR1 family protein